MSHHEKGLARVLGAVKHDVYIIPVCIIAFKLLLLFIQNISPILIG